MKKIFNTIKSKPALSIITLIIFIAILVINIINIDNSFKPFEILGVCFNSLGFIIGGYYASYVIAKNEINIDVEKKFQEYEEEIQKYKEEIQEHKEIKESLKKQCKKQIIKNIICEYNALCSANAEEVRKDVEERSIISSTTEKLFPKAAEYIKETINYLASIWANKKIYIELSDFFNEELNNFWWRNEKHKEEIPEDLKKEVEQKRKEFFEEIENKISEYC